MLTLVSVIIPCYKNSNTLGRAIDSVLGQSKKVHEVLVVNDASPESDKIEAVISKYPQVRYIVNSRNLGLAATRNVGVNAATGNLVSFLDADDELHPQKIEFQCYAYKRGTVVSCNYYRCENSKTTDFKKFGSDFKTTTYDSVSSIIFQNKITGASILLSKKDFNRIGSYDESLRSCEDYDLSLRLLDNYIPIININLPLYIYKHNPDGLSTNLKQILNWQIRVIKKNLFKPTTNIFHRLLIEFILCIWIFKHIVRCEGAISRELRDEIKSIINRSIENSFFKLIIFLIFYSRFARLIYWLRLSKKRKKFKL